MTDRALLLERLERLAIVLDELMPGCAELVRDTISLLKEQEGYVSVPFSWLVKFCTHIDFKEPLTDAEREAAWRKKLWQQFGIDASKKAVKKLMSEERIEMLKKALALYGFAVDQRNEYDERNKFFCMVEELSQIVGADLHS